MTYKISEITDSYIAFTNGDKITFDHYQDCCEYNYADFEQVDDYARQYEFRAPLKFEAIDEAGFRFGDGYAMFFVPCYSEQNGYYSTGIDIYLNEERVLDFSCNERDWY